MSQHTPGRWEVPGPSPDLIGTTNPRKLVAQTYGDSHEEIEANARRIVACVNACAGVPTEALEAFAKHGIFKRLWDTEWEQAFNDH